MPTQRLKLYGANIFSFTVFPTTGAWDKKGVCCVSCSFHLSCYKKNCFVKEKGKKESLLPSGCIKRQKGNGINHIWRTVGILCLCRSLFGNFNKSAALKPLLLLSHLPQFLTRLIYQNLRIDSSLQDVFFINQVLDLFFWKAK